MNSIKGAITLLILSGNEKAMRAVLIDPAVTPMVAKVIVCEKSSNNSSEFHYGLFWAILYVFLN